MAKIIRATASEPSTYVLEQAQDVASLPEHMTVNRAGGPAYRLPDGEALLSYLMTGSYAKGTYYADAKGIQAEARGVFERAVAAEPKLTAQAIVHARTEGYMRAAPILALAILSKSANPEAKRYARNIAPAVLRTPGDLQDFWKAVHGEGRVRGIGRLPRTIGNDFLRGLTPYHAVKYGSEKQSGTASFSLRDIVRMVHPHGLAPDAWAAVQYLANGTVSEATPAQIRAYENFKGATATLDDLLAMVTQHRLPWEVVAPQLEKMTGTERTQAWRAMAAQMPYMALIRNLRNLLKHGVLDDLATRVALLDILADPKRVAASMQMPFRFVSAIRAIESSGEGSATARRETVHALDTALDLSVGNMPDLGEHVFLSNDVSGSMRSRISYDTRADDPTTYDDIASLFLAAAYKRAEDATVVSFNGAAIPRTNLRRSLNVRKLADAVRGDGGSTSLWAPIQAATNSGRHYKTLAFFSDNESWAGEWLGHERYWRLGAERTPQVSGGSRTQRAVMTYLKAYPDAHFFFVNLAASAAVPVDPQTPNVHFIYGWSADVLRYIGQTVQGTGQWQAIEQVDVETPRSAKRAIGTTADATLDMGSEG